jgi:steroid 5-alpha reductase family enzyme
MNYFLNLASVLFLYMNIWFIVSLIVKRNDVADIAWGLGFVLLAWFSFHLSGSEIRPLIINILITLWGIRLGWHIFKRNLNKPEDYRYLAWRKEWKHFTLRSYLQVYMLQGVLLYLIALPVVIINRSTDAGIGWIDGVGICVWLIGFYFETVGDWQLKKFISKSENKGRIMDHGLWRYSRHPNYFGEVLQWWGIFIVALSLPDGWITMVGPITITILILFVSGIPLLEKKYVGKSYFEEYKKRTSIFIPLPPKGS